MTRRIVVSAALLLCAIGASAESAAGAEASASPGALIGIQAGATASGLHFAEYPVHDSAIRVGGSTGLLVVFPRSRHSALQIGAAIRTAGGTYSYEVFDEHTGTFSPRRGAIELTYVAFPVGIRIGQSSPESGPSLAMGADLSYLVRYFQRVRAGNSRVVFSSRARSLVYEWELAGFVTLGAGFPLARQRLFADLSYRHGVSPLQRSTWGGNSPHDGSDRALTLSLGMWL